MYSVYKSIFLRFLTSHSFILYFSCQSKKFSATNGAVVGHIMQPWWLVQHRSIVFSTTLQKFDDFCCVFEEQRFSNHSHIHRDLSVFISLRDFHLINDNASFNSKNIRADSPDVIMSMVPDQVSL